MRTDTLLFILGYILGNPSARAFVIKASDKLGKFTEDKLKEMKDVLDKEIKEKRHDTQIL